jgi:LemA protein
MWIIIGVIVLWAVFVFNRLVNLRARVKAAWSDIDVQLRRRHDLIPVLVDAVKNYMAYERSTFEAVTAAREAAMSASRDVASRAIAESRLTKALSVLLAGVEAYPVLRASENALMLQEELTSTENRIAFARQHFNDCVMSYNTKIGSFPAMLIAEPTGFKAESFFEIDEASRVPTEVKL